MRIFADDKLAQLKPEGESHVKKDDVMSGLYLEALPDGRKKWRLEIRGEGRTRRKTLGAYPTMGVLDARKAASRIIFASPEPPASGPAAEARKDGSFGDLTRVWLVQERGNLKRDAYKRRFSLLKSHILPAIGRQALAGMSPSTMVLDLLKPLAERGGQDLARSALEVCRLILRFGLSSGLISADPTEGLPEFESEPLTCQIVPNIDPNFDPAHASPGRADPSVSLHQSDSAVKKAHHYQIKRNPLLLTDLGRPKLSTD